MNKEIYKNHYPVIAPLLMGSGVGDGQTKACVMAQAATIDALRRGKTLDKPTDKMECACPVLRALAIGLNDGSWWKDDEERTETLRPLIPMLLDSRGSIDLMLKRSTACAKAAKESAERATKKKPIAAERAAKCAEYAAAAATRAAAECATRAAECAECAKCAAEYAAEYAAECAKCAAKCAAEYAAAERTALLALFRECAEMKD